jgi:hypothetical protein
VIDDESCENSLSFSGSDLSFGSDDSLPVPIPRRTTPKSNSDNPSNRQKRPKKKRVQVTKKVPAYDAIPDAHDPRYDDIPANPIPMPSHGGAPRNELADLLVIPCYVAGKPKIAKNHRFRCIASSICSYKLTNTKRQIDRILKHASRCPVLRYWKPQLHSQAIDEYAQRAPSAKLVANLEVSYCLVSLFVH